MKTSDDGIALIKRFEGFSPCVYQCPAGYFTIGYGHVVRTSEHFSAGMDEIAAENILRADLRIAEIAVVRLIGVTLAQHQFDALVSFTYNLGAGRLQMSRLRARINRGERDVAAEFTRWVFVRGRKLSGLVARRAAEAALYMD